MLIVAILVGLVAVASALGLIWRASQGRVRAAAGRIEGLQLGERATLLQLSSEFCSPCRSTARVLTGISTGDIRHIEVDI
ncbi:MAG: thioredoxin, partial [Actinomycetota bacterium]|nr:thioredoxin [Actinomycetota bacterium]